MPATSKIALLRLPERPKTTKNPNYTKSQSRIDDWRLNSAQKREIEAKCERNLRRFELTWFSLQGGLIEVREEPLELLCGLFLSEVF